MGQAQCIMHHTTRYGHTALYNASLKKTAFIGCLKYLHRLLCWERNQARCLPLAPTQRQRLPLQNPASCNHIARVPDTRLSTQNQFWKMFVLSAFCFPELRLWLYHHVSSQIVVRGLDVGSAREAAVLDSQTRHVSPPSGGANMLLLLLPDQNAKAETQLNTCLLCSLWHNDTHIHTAVDRIHTEFVARLPLILFSVNIHQA